MLRRIIETLVVLLVIATVAMLGAARIWHEPGQGIYWRIAGLLQLPKDWEPVDFVALQRRAGPSDALVCPERLCQKAKPELVSPYSRCPLTICAKK